MSPEPLTPGSRFGGYLITRSIGAGGMAHVYEAVHVGLKKRVALKVLNRSFAAQPDAKTRFLREGEAASRIRHPNVVDITDVGIADDVPYLVMEYLEGESLEELLQRTPILDAQRTADLMVPVIAAVGAAHDADVVHRDIKPDNIFLAQVTHGVQPKVLDFGISKVIEATSDTPSVDAAAGPGFMGTPYYMSPEHARNFARADARSDQYALGVVLYECLTGRLPYQDEGLMEVLHAITVGIHPSVRSIVSDVPRELEAIVERAMALTPADRFESCHDLGAALLPFAGRRTRMVWEAHFGVTREDGSVPPPANESEVRPSERAPSMPTPPTDVVFPLAPRVPKVTPAHAGPSASRKPTPPIASPIMLSSLEPEERPRGVGMALFVGVIVALGVAVAVVMISRSGPSTDTPDSSRLATGGVAAPVVSAQQPSTVEVSEDALDTPPTSFSVSVRTEPPNATISFDGDAVGNGVFERTLQIDGHDHELLVEQDGYMPQLIRFVDTAPPSEIVLDALTVAQPAVPTRGAPRGMGRPTVRGGMATPSPTVMVVPTTDPRPTPVASPPTPAVVPSTNTEVGPANNAPILD